MNFERLIDVIIGKRVKNFRTNTLTKNKANNIRKQTQEEFCYKLEDYSEETGIYINFDKYRLSDIENGKRNKKKNPHFLTESLIELFSKMMKVSKSEFLFGNKDEKEVLTKIILLNIFMNSTTEAGGPAPTYEQGEQTPIIGVEKTDKEFFRLAMLNIDSYDDKKDYDLLKNAYSDLNKNQWNNDKYSLNEVKKIALAKLKQFDDFFYNREYAKLYKLTMGQKTDFAKPASIILRCLFGNFNFASGFLERIDNLENYHYGGCKLRKPNIKNFYLDNYLYGKSNFSSRATDWKEVSFKLFIKAFNEFFILYKSDIENFFEATIFSKSLEQLTNQYVNSLFKEEKFVAFLNDIYFRDQYSLNRMTGHNYANTKMQEFTLTAENSKKYLKSGIKLPYKDKGPFSAYNYPDYKNDNYDLSKYLYDFSIMTNRYAKQDYKIKDIFLFLPKYFKCITF